MTVIDRMLINGQWSKGSGERIEVLNPARGTVVGTVPHATAREVDTALNAAQTAFGTWSKEPPATRARLLKRAAEIIADQTDSLARLMTSEQGKPVREAAGEISKLAETFEFYAAEATRVFGEIIPNDENAFQSLVLREPIGVIAAISPWNYPAELIGWKIAAGLAAGCTFVVKPPELTPLTPLAIAACLAEAGFPAGAVNMVTGGGSTVGQYMIESPIPDKIAFTGSSQVGLHIQQSSKTIKRMSLELGGNCPMIVTETADLEDAVRGAARRSFRNCGQICIAINRIYVARNIYAVFLAKLSKAADALVVDDGLKNPAADLGALCSNEPLRKTKEHIADALSNGARIVCGGSAPAAAHLKNGYFFRPTVLADCTHAMKVMTEETFGPLVGIATFDKKEEAVRRANDTPYGLASYVYTKNLDEMRYFSRHLDYGNVAVNNVDAGIINAPYGGWKQSGVGVEHGREGLLEYLNFKHVRICFDEEAAP